MPGAYVVELEPVSDERGWFARTFCREEFEAWGLEPAVAQCSVSFNERAGTLRGLHYQAEPYGESKLVRCTRGWVYDVLVDLRRDSPAYRRWFATELTPDDGRMVYAPVGVAHGFQTLSDGCEVHYQMGAPYQPSHARGVRWDDPAFGIEWPPAERTISPHDRGFPDFDP